ncbi:hypothetical protein KPL70_003973 [Citrus sinensis]|uniref:Uncharacterized protein n=1 Tax=Citrus clementina TaxID=85681 RepID=V4W4M7_CITCL|nr:hypothetical protein CICLE_v10017917mg [Citrus x clementina]KAH9745202.1 hypothetical protein KPL70_003973 [Citrus sinensis]GAY53133.1 hypothetical protein CUMW_147060 [Citrus unshiu]
MGRQSGDSTAVSSSIALLQERFRQLEREREKREEKDLLKLFSDSDQAALAMRFDRNKPSFPQETILPHSHRPALEDHSLSLGLSSQGKHADFQATTSPASASLWPNGAATPSTSRNFDHSDVDTSLHL